MDGVPPIVKVDAGPSPEVTPTGTVLQLIVGVPPDTFNTIKFNAEFLHTFWVKAPDGLAKPISTVIVPVKMLCAVQAPLVVTVYS